MPHEGHGEAAPATAFNWNVAVNSTPGPVPLGWMGGNTQEAAMVAIRGRYELGNRFLSTLSTIASSPLVLLDSAVPPVCNNETVD